MKVQYIIDNYFTQTDEETIDGATQTWYELNEGIVIMVMNPDKDYPMTLAHLQVYTNDPEGDGALGFSYDEEIAINVNNPELEVSAKVYELKEEG